LPFDQVAHKDQVDRLAALHARYFQIHDDTFEPGAIRGALRRFGAISRAPLDTYVPELKAMHEELTAIAAAWKPRLREMSELLGDSEAAADSYDAVAHLDTCVVWLHHIASRYVNGAPYPEDEVLKERMAYEGARANAQAHAARMNAVFAAISKRLN
jgi:hypothetical protein